MVRTRRESHHHDGITDPKDLQLPFATKSARSGLKHCNNFVVEKAGVKLKAPIPQFTAARCRRRG
jgi:hypothetical protein